MRQSEERSYERRLERSDPRMSQKHYTAFLHKLAGAKRQQHIKSDNSISTRLFKGTLFCARFARALQLVATLLASRIIPLLFLILFRSSQFLPDPLCNLPLPKLPNLPSALRRIPLRMHRPPRNPHNVHGHHTLQLHSPPKQP